MGHIDVHVPHSLYESILWKIHGIIFAVDHLWGKCIPYSFHYLGECTILKGWNIVAKPLHQLCVHDSSVCSVVTICFNSSNACCNSWDGWLQSGWLGSLPGIMLLPSWRLVPIRHQWSCVGLMLCYVSSVIISWLVDTLFVSTCTWGGLEPYGFTIHQGRGDHGVEQPYFSMGVSEVCLVELSFWHG